MKMNPDFDAIMKKRRYAQWQNREADKGIMRRIPVPKQPNRYLPHTGAKEAVRYAGKTTL